ncbi:MULTISPECIES: WecB/TagA/CpsF family glycosyltransferase [Alphaproteobacteria]|uniref:UDP-N-acetyl-D-mannosaminuronic acid transferase n=2 Tax=Alphaproteobacteria TaxID=28211 RepID=A0A512HIF9_9HYPH|nr:MULTISPECIES: WecB/TagA/CpsF family glycosyltransferase [Alphaproteobacteria]GEO85228.1 UDP-N-acetyl-D-mannosaminuronic acid transferase [Ciceribacter naphthalenivorans]GLR24438.1 UDP-N-acetyl-D-mannosaminuronic acid transferase [Ciceribacter naphthalenivorans]GLT07294.1 UDP-N-acetyl-D-mannosaminuronic acid transferase [Sphingomonas psychrolutea]
MTMQPSLSLPEARLPVFGVPVYDLTWRDALSYVNELTAQSFGQTHVAFLNANNANLMMSDSDYRAALGRTILLPDGIGVDLASHVLNGERFVANLNGTDFIPAMLSYMDTPRRIGLVGGRPEVLAEAAVNFRRHAPWHEFIAISDGFFDKVNCAAVLDDLKAARLDILLVALGTPLQEVWIDRNIRPEHARLVVGVGALFDFISGQVPRAPPWMRRLRCEWVYRLWLEPRRLWYRYVVGIPVFLGHVVRYKFLGPPRHPGGKDPAPPSAGAAE